MKIHVLRLNRCKILIASCNTRCLFTTTRYMFLQLVWQILWVTFSVSCDFLPGFVAIYPKHYLIFCIFSVYLLKLALLFPKCCKWDWFNAIRGCPPNRKGPSWKPAGCMAGLRAQPRCEVPSDLWVKNITYCPLRFSYKETFNGQTFFYPQLPRGQCQMKYHPSHLTKYHSYMK